MSKYIKLEDVLETVNWPWRWDVTLEKLNSLPSVNFDEMIKEMINAPEMINWVFNPEYIKYKIPLRIAKSRIQALSEEQKIMRVWDDDDYSRKIEWLFVWFTSDWDAVIENEKYWLVRRNNFETVTPNK